MIDYITIVLSLACLVSLRFFFRRIRQTGEPPIEHHPIPFVGHALEFGKDPEGCLKQLQLKHGDVFSMHMAGWNYHIFMNPYDIVPIEKNKALQQGPILKDFTTRMVGNQHSIHQEQSNVSKSILKSGIQKILRLVHGADKKEKDQIKDKDTMERALVKSLRGTNELQALFKSSLENTNIFIKLLKQGKISMHNSDGTVNLIDFCYRTIFHVTFSILFGTLPDEEESLKEINTFYQVFSEYNRQSALLVDRIPIYMLPKVKKARKEILELLKAMDWSKRINTSSLITHIRRVDSDPERQIRHLLIILWSAQANTAPGLFWMLFYILKHPNAKSNIIQEFDCFVNKQNLTRESDQNNNQSQTNQNESLAMTKTDLDKLYVLDSSFKEMTRLSGSSMVVRKAVEDTSVTVEQGCYNIRKGDYAVFYSPVLHHDSEVYKNSSQFKFDRYLEEITPKSPAEKVVFENYKPKTKFYKSGRRLNSSNTILTFGVGPQRCPGRHLASMEIKLLTLSLLKSFDISLLSDKSPECDLTHLGFGIMPPKEKVFIKFS